MARFIAEHLDEDNFSIAKQFLAAYEETGLEKYLCKRRYALTNEIQGKTRTYLVFTEDREFFVGYFTLCSGSVPYLPAFSNPHEEKRIPGIELVNICLNKRFLKAHNDSPKGLGTYIFQSLILPKVNEVASIVGVKILYLYAVNTAVQEHFKKWGFELVQDDAYAQIVSDTQTAHYSHDCIFMYRLVC